MARRRKPAPTVRLSDHTLMVPTPIRAAVLGHLRAHGITELFTTGAGEHAILYFATGADQVAAFRQIDRLAALMRPHHRAFADACASVTPEGIHV